MRTDDGGLIAGDLNRRIDSSYAFVSETLHLLLVVDKRPEGTNRFARRNGLFDHIDSTLYPEAKTVFISQ
jgi:hypothetical protein